MLRTGFALLGALCVALTPDALESAFESFADDVADLAAEVAPAAAEVAPRAEVAPDDSAATWTAPDLATYADACAVVVWDDALGSCYSEGWSDQSEDDRACSEWRTYAPPSAAYLQWRAEGIANGTLRAIPYGVENLAYRANGGQ